MVSICLNLIQIVSIYFKHFQNRLVYFIIFQYISVTTGSIRQKLQQTLANIKQTSTHHSSPLSWFAGSRTTALKATTELMATSLVDWRGFFIPFHKVITMPISTVEPAVGVLNRTTLPCLGWRVWGDLYKMVQHGMAGHSLDGVGFLEI